MGGRGSRVWVGLGPRWAERFIMCSEWLSDSINRPASCNEEADIGCNTLLPGPRRLKDSKSEGAMLKETTNINKSLFVLGKVISALAERESSGTTAHIPYRCGRGAGRSCMGPGREGEAGCGGRGGTGPDATLCPPYPLNFHFRCKVIF